MSKLSQIVPRADGVRSGLPFRSRLRRVGVRFLPAVLVAGLIAVVLFVVLWFALPYPVARLAPPPAGPVVTDRSGGPLLRCVARDGNWCEPVPLAEVSPWLIQATIAVEDARFATHVGIDPWAVGRAALQNTAAMRTVSGASTITMQLARMIEPRPRTFPGKIAQAFRALQLNAVADKDRQMTLYLNLAPYGGNVRGVEAAARRYLGKSAKDLSLGEAALLAGLPQSPSRYRPDRHLDRALARRRVVLQRMAELGEISPQQKTSAANEPVALRRSEPADIAPHAAALALARRPGGGRTAIDRSIQTDVTRLATGHVRNLPADTDAAVVVIDIRTGDILALVGGVHPGDRRAGRVNAALAPRSPGSALKPFIYAAAMDADLLDPETLVYDVPIDRDGWRPENFDREYLGPLPAAQALRRSRNMPAILVAEAVGPPRCVGLLESVGIRLPGAAGSRAGLAIATGAADVTLLDLTNAYATLGRGGAFRPARLFLDEPSAAKPALSARACAAVSGILSSRLRRPRGMENLAVEEIPWFTWKTGTSSGRRDAWAIGHNGQYAVGVWTGRLAGGGDPRFVGAEAAEPLLAEIMALTCLRNDDAPPPVRAWHAARPMPPPPEVAGPLRILSPTPNATFVATSPTVTITVRMNRPAAGVTSFLDDKLIAFGDGRLTLSPGRHHLRCLDRDGTLAECRFTVEDAARIASRSE